MKIHINIFDSKLSVHTKHLISITFDKHCNLIKNKTSKLSIILNHNTSKNQKHYDTQIIISKKKDTYSKSLLIHNSINTFSKILTIYFNNFKNRFKIKIYLFSVCKIFRHQQNLLNYHLKNYEFKNFNTLSLLKKTPQHIYNKNVPDIYINNIGRKAYYLLPITEYFIISENKPMNPKILDIMELYRKYGNKGGYKQIMINFSNHKYLFECNKNIYWIPKRYKYYIIRPITNNFKINLNGKNKRYFNIYKILPISLYKILKEFKLDKIKIDLCICGSSILKLVTNLSFKSDIDIIIKCKYSSKNIIHLFVGYIMSKLYSNNIKSSVLCYLKNNIRIKIKYNNHEDIILNIFTKIGELCEIIKNFHLPCIRAIYSLKKEEIYCYNSFIRSLALKINYNIIKKWHYDEKIILGIYTKYFRRGFGCLFNEYDKNKFIKHLKKNNIKYTLEKYNQ